MRTDVLIIGGGITARRTAAVLSERYSVILVQDGAGASPYIHGLNVPLLENDSAELLYRDTLESGRYQNNKALAKALAEGSISVANEYKDAFDKAPNGEFELLKPLGSTLPRVAGMEGRTGIKILSELREAQKYTELSHTRAVRLLTDGGEVTGALLFDKKENTFFAVNARAVLIACGGFGGVFPFSTNSVDIGGDGIAMAYEAGAELVDMEFIQYEPTVAVSPKEIKGKSIITTMLFEGAVIRNKNGERFMDERVGKDALSAGIYRELLNGGGTENGGVFFDMTGVPEEMLLGKYKDYFDRYARVGIDIRKVPVEITPAPHTTMGGIKIDESCRTNVKGLFAAGESAGGIHGANRLGGNAGLEVLVFGDTAGRAIVKMLDEAGEERTRNEDIAEKNFSDLCIDLTSEREKLHDICKNALGVIRSGEKLSDALKAVGEIIKSVENYPESFGAVRLYNDALTVKTVISAALLREESIGSHIRSDCNDTFEGKYSIVIKKENGALTERKEKIK